MRAVNLIPAEQRRGAGGTGGRSQGAAYAVLGVLLGFVVLGAVYAVAHHQINDRRSKLANATQETQAALARASALAPYTSFAALRTQRLQGIAQLANGRFDWAHAMHEVGRVLPKDVTLAGLKGTIGAAPPAAGGTQPATTAAAASGTTPTIELTGCAVGGQTEVARVMTRARLIDGVAGVTLRSSDKGAVAPSSSTGAASAAGTSSTAAAATGPCGSHRPNFDMTVFFAPLAGAVPAAASATAPGAATTTPAASSPQASVSNGPASAPATGAGTTAGGSK